MRAREQSIVANVARRRGGKRAFDLGLSLLQPPEIQTVRFVFVSTSATNAACASGLGSRLLSVNERRCESAATT